MLLRKLASFQTTSYQISLPPAGRIAATASVAFETLFTGYYLATGYPNPIVLVQLAANLLGALGLILAYRTRAVKPAAHILVSGLFLSLIGPAFFTGGIDSSCLVWLVFVPIMATIISGWRGGLTWSGLSIAAAVGYYSFDPVIQTVNLRPTLNLDRLIDLVFATLSAAWATLSNEQVKAQHMKELDEAHARLTNLANLDPLTNVYNRRYFFIQGEAALNQAQSGREFSILLLDIDHFKRVNDLHGHVVGDQVLKGVVQVCAVILRKDDLLARLGGEEFIALLPATSLAEAQEVAERLRASLEATPLITDHGPIQVTLSIGLSACLRSGEDTIKEILRRADGAMYTAKNAGRNQVIAWSRLPAGFSKYPDLLSAKEH
jgi:diguanylate cyclase (GGDEF)-like protein